MNTEVKIHMYNQNNLGDCFLLQFNQGADTSFLLIDFGSYENGNKTRELEIANSIKKIVGDNPLRIVLTHQHKDHLSGFISASTVFDQMKIAELWLSYLDDPNGKEAESVRDLMKKFWLKNEETKKLVRKKFKSVSSVKKMLDAKDNIDLFAETQTGGNAYTNLLRWTKKRKFLLPGSTFDMPGLSGKGVKIYVLGPPLDDTLLKKMNPSKDEAVHGLNATISLLNLDTSSQLMADALNALSPEIATTAGVENFPFSKAFSTPLKEDHPMKSLYHKESWRKVDHEWLAEIGRTSLHMDNLTNNSSLVLAFELVESGKVLLFAADAQIGNWKSWFDIKFKDSETTSRDLLSRTVVYKAGHHSSHNATLSEGLELMNTEELVILIPVNEKVSTARNFAMLKPGMLLGYNRKAEGRVLRSDTIYHQPKSVKQFKFPFKKKPGDFKPKIEIEKDKTKTNHLYIAYTVTG